MARLPLVQDHLHLSERFAVALQRTLRIPDDGRAYPVPPGLEPLPLYRVADFADQVPPAWREPGEVFMPMYQRETLRSVACGRGSGGRRLGLWCATLCASGGAHSGIPHPQGRQDAQGRETADDDEGIVVARQSGLRVNELL